MSAAQRNTLMLKGHAPIVPPVVWLGQSVRTTVVTRRYPALAKACWMASLGDAVHRPRLIERVFCGELRERLGAQGPIMLDSGGFTMMMKSQKLDIVEIAAIYNRTSAELCISLDIPPLGRDRSHTRLRKYDETRSNLHYLAERLDPDRLVPVIHGTTVIEIAQNCERVMEVHTRPRMVCLGGLVPLLRRTGRTFEARSRAFSWIRDCIAEVRRQFPRSLIHILGAGAPQTVSDVICCGADSTDSLAWRRAAGFGTIYLPGTSERFVASRSRARATSRPLLNASELEQLAACACPACKEWPRLEDRINDLSNSYLARAAHNAFVVLSGVKSLALMRRKGTLVTTPSTHHTPRGTAPAASAGACRPSQSSGRSTGPAPPPDRRR